MAGKSAACAVAKRIKAPKASVSRRSVLGACLARAEHADQIRAGNPTDKKILRCSARRQSAGRNRGSEAWVQYIPSFIAICILTFAFWRENGGIARGVIFRFPVVPVLGEGRYEMSSVGTIGAVVEREGLWNKKLAVWGGELARAHDLPFGYRVATDWFLLPGKPVPVLATQEEIQDFDYVLSPWDLGNRLDSPGYQPEVSSEGNFVWLYRMRRPERSQE